ncbi:MAG: TetR/AcrR family transcriptional regulator [Peptococcaceae bacterium]|jgi:AcrR family transcriptional regulator|nr:TetR/AcrR family transcriptional regulator [Peptococcaceae bacterium]
MEGQKKNRRRGEVLEAAILQAAWDELREVGYNRLTMEGVAARAKTNKAVVYRRWANKAQLVSAALRKYIMRPVTEVPDTGSLREDVRMLLRGLSSVLQTIGAETMRGLMGEHSLNDMVTHIPGKKNRLTITMTAILRHAEQRGEINPGKMTPRVISLPLDLMRYEILTTLEPMADHVIDEIVDTIFIPLVRR